MQEQNTNSQVEYFHKADLEYPFDYRFRTASALRMGQITLSMNIDQSLQLIAASELDVALKFDPYSSELLGQAIIINFNLGNTKSAQEYYDRFKQVDKNSRMIEYFYNLGLH